jgi:hypothetical protein
MYTHVSKCKNDKIKGEKRKKGRKEGREGGRGKEGREGGRERGRGERRGGEGRNIGESNINRQTFTVATLGRC